jgi:hypothetical protein
MVFNKSKNSYLLLLVLLILAIFSSCSAIQDFFGINNKVNRSNNGTVTLNNNPNARRPGGFLPPEEIESQALSYYQSARIFEGQYYDTKKTEYAQIAIEKFIKYYNLLPTGSFAGFALLRISELSYRIGDLNGAYVGLRTIKSRYDLTIKYKSEISLLENLIRK